MRVPEDYDCFSTFNPKFKPFGIQWPDEIVDKQKVNVMKKGLADYRVAVHGWSG